jgi:diguanylate cyclase (GGDEF)-like protein
MATGPVSEPSPPGFVTGNLPDHGAIVRALDDLLAAGRCAWLLICGLDRFHLVNEALGRAAGDEALAQIGARLARVVHKGDVLGRFGGDQFAIVCGHMRCAPRQLAADLRCAVREPTRVGGSEFVVTGSIGMARAAAGLSTLDTFVAADAAYFVAKERGRDRVELFDAGMRDTAVATWNRTSELRQAIENHQLLLYYQPIVELATERLIGCEGLLRWVHPEEGLLTTSSFLELAASSGLMGELTPRLIDETARAGRFVADAVSPDAFVAVNISASQLGDELVQQIENALEVARLPPDRLVVELTETTVLQDPDVALRTLTRLRDQGVGVALDDFGTGYSSLLNLRRLPITKLKLDRTFVNGCLRDRDDLAIVASVIDLSIRLDIDCIAEGVESRQQAELLVELGCRAGQGHLWSPAVPLEQLR